MFPLARSFPHMSLYLRGRKPKVRGSIVGLDRGYRRDTLEADNEQQPCLLLGEPPSSEPVGPWVWAASFSVKEFPGV